jgi:uncharacterized membrane protein YphA (DoxX/SURF4 family)
MATSSKAVRTLLLVLRIVLGAVFVYAAYTKLRYPWQLFAMSIDSYELLPLWAVTFLARTLPWAELAIGVLLVAGRWLRLSTTVTTLLLLVFFVLMIRAYAKGMEINCGCFGPGEAISWKTLVRDGSLLAGSVLLTLTSFGRRRSMA